MAWTKEQQRAYSRKHYLANKEKRLAQQKAWNEANKDKMKEYQKQWEADHREERNMKQRETDAKGYERELVARSESEMITPAVAAAMLNISLRQFRQWVTDGKIPSVKTPTNRRLIARKDVEALTQARATNPNIQVRAVKTSGEFIVPEGFDLITEYKDLTEYSLAFAAKKIGFLLLVGTPGSGKSRQIKADLAGKSCTWIDNHVTNLGMYCSVYDANGMPVILDDVNHFLANKIACSLIKALTQTEEKKSVSWESPMNKLLEEREIPRHYTTTSPICLIANMWDMKNADYAAIQDRSLPVAFFPSAETIHNRVIELGWCNDKEIIDYIGENLVNIPQPSMREYYQATCYKRAGMDWKKKLSAIWGL